MVLNGYVPASDLVTVQTGIQLSRPTANAWMAFIQEGSRTGHRLGIASPAGGYRSFAVQKDMRANPRKYGLNPASKLKLAAAGHSTHGFGDRVDIVGDLAWAIANGPRFGFVREFGPADPNHFIHDGVTATSGAANDYTLEHQLSEEDGMYFRADVSDNVFKTVYDPVTGGTGYYLCNKYEASWARDLVPSLVRVSSLEAFNAFTASIPYVKPSTATAPSGSVDEASIAEKVLTRFRSFWTTGK